MATNKRKDAAALFELIDKSTLKVPKAAGSLKIPHWWSSKTNPAAAPPAPAESPKHPTSSNPAAPGTSKPARPVAEAPAIPSSPLPTAAAGVLEPPPQPRLFDPPPASRPPSASPTIRPPSASVRPPVSPPVSPSVRAPGPPPPPIKSAVSAAAAPAHVSAAPSPVPPSAAPVPLTAAPRNPFAPPRPGAFARLPAWVLVSLGSGFVIVACILGYVIERHAHSGTPSSASPGTQISPQNPPAQGPSHGTTPASSDGIGSGHILPGSMAGTPQQLLPPAGGPSAPAPAPPRPAPAPGPVPAQTVGHFYEPGIVKRNTPEMVAANGPLYFIEIASSPSEDISRRNGKFLADHGIDVSMEKKLIQKTVMFQLVTVQGFPTTTAAEPFVKRIREIGHELPEYKRTHKAWDDAFPTKYQNAANQ